MKEFMRKKEFVILSGELSSKDAGYNNRATNNLELCLKDLGLEYKEVKGCYKGSEEVSFMVMAPTETDMETVRDLGLKSFGQESVLFRDYTGKVSLMFANSIESLGIFHNIPQSEALKQDAYTLVDNQYWVVR